MPSVLRIGRKRAKTFCLCMNHLTTNLAPCFTLKPLDSLKTPVFSMVMSASLSTVKVELASPPSVALEA